jgi:pantoate--beta-alanine ligase
MRRIPGRRTLLLIFPSFTSTVMLQVISAIPDLRARLHGETGVVFVPTMGNLHDGHLALVREARRHGNCVAVSIFVNPLQFGPNEDLAKYPRTLAQDREKLEAEGVDVLFTPGEKDLFPAPQVVHVEPPPIANELCGAFRPGHFRGVATIVLKLFNIVQPNVAIFGKKDYQQLHIVRTMVEQLDVPVEVLAGETGRASDGLALSSRNGYLSGDERTEAVRLYRTLGTVAELVLAGGKDFQGMEADAEKTLSRHGWKVDYVSVRAQSTLAPASATDSRLVILGAAWLGKTRLIDNIEVCLEASQAV